MYSAVVAHNIPGIKAVLPIYEQCQSTTAPWHAMLKVAAHPKGAPPKPSTITAAYAEQPEASCRPLAACNRLI